MAQGALQGTSGMTYRSGRKALFLAMPQSIKYVITKFRKSLRIALTRTMLVGDVVKSYASVLTDAEGKQVSRRSKIFDTVFSDQEAEVTNVTGSSSGPLSSTSALFTADRRWCRHCRYGQHRPVTDSQLYISGYATGVGDRVPAL